VPLGVDQATTTYESELVLRVSVADLAITVDQRGTLIPSCGLNLADFVSPSSH